ncbi:HEXXH motif-containing putative peptide modification protein [Saccharopolyspora rosea]|uniref:HEXXH motif-containing putative peptide modification protein n=1 Tax=Saccharopolyspora rosea TaxID=524884 RepID=A0ABW3G2Z6_9PSEU
MTARHRIPGEVFAALARGGGGPEAIRLLADARRSKTLLLLRAILDLADATGHPGARLTRCAFRALGEVERRAPRAVADVVGYPHVGAWALRTALRLDAGRTEEAEPERLAHVAAAAAWRGGVDVPVELPPAESVALPSVGVATLPAPPCGPVHLVAGTLTDGRTTAQLGSGPGWRGLDRIRAEHDGLRLDLAVDGLGDRPVPDNVAVEPALPSPDHHPPRKRLRATDNPSPDHHPPRKRLRATDNPSPDHHPPPRRPRATGSARRDLWQRRLAEGWRHLVRWHRPVAEEVAAALRVLTPLVNSSTGQVSATFNDLFGCVAMSLPDDARSAALTLAHEVQHTKLAALIDLVPLLAPDDGVRFYAPWREDPRPAAGLLQGIYAHLGVTGFWRRERPDRRADTEFARWRTATRDAARTLAEHGDLTGAGRDFLAHLLPVLQSWCDDEVSPAAQAEAERLAAEHRRRWLARNRPS